MRNFKYSLIVGTLFLIHSDIFSQDGNAKKAFTIRIQLTASINEPLVVFINQSPYEFHAVGDRVFARAFSDLEIKDIRILRQPETNSCIDTVILIRGPDKDGSTWYYTYKVNFHFDFTSSVSSSW